jgi:orotidine-5'-phosphate decarboxylase
MSKETTPRLFVALDGLDTDPLRTIRAVRQLLLDAAMHTKIGIKIPPTIWRRIGTKGLINWLCQEIDVELIRRIPVFLDGKLHENPRDAIRTCQDLIRELEKWRLFGLINIHATMPDLSEVVAMVKDSPLDIYIQSVLSFGGVTDEWCRYHYGRSRLELVSLHASIAHDIGCVGIVCPAAIALRAKETVASYDLHVMATGIRIDSSDGIHQDPVHPRLAYDAGASVVMGGEIMTMHGRVVEPSVAHKRVKEVLAL